MGVVFEARQKSLKRLVALKMLLPGLYLGDDERARFRAEAEAFGRLQHPNIVQVYECGEHQGQPYFAMELVAGGTLARRAKAQPYSAIAAAGLVATLARAVHYAHQRGLVHRDLKPANVLLGADETPKITDFGLVKRLDSDAGQTTTGAILGTPSYMAPEQAEGRTKEIGPSVDVYALGAILYELVAGRPPFRAESAWKTVQEVISGEPPSPRCFAPSLPRDLETICLKCLAKTPSGRYESAAALAEDLERFAAGQSIAARPAGVLRRAWRAVRKRISPLAIGVIALLLLFCFAGCWGLFTLGVVIDAQGVADDLREHPALHEHLGADFELSTNFAASLSQHEGNSVYTARGSRGHGTILVKFESWMGPKIESAVLRLPNGQQVQLVPRT